MAGQEDCGVQESKLLDTYLTYLSRAKRIEIADDPKRLLNDSMILNDSSKEC